METAIKTQYHVSVNDTFGFPRDVETFVCEAHSQEEAAKMALEVYPDYEVEAVYEPSWNYKMTTDQVVRYMLKEPVSRSIVDSGSAYGYNFEREVNTTERIKGKFYVYQSSPEEPGRLWANFTINLYHWMIQNLEFDAELTSLMGYKASELVPEHASNLELAEAFACWLQESRNPGVDTCTEYTYHIEHHLSQDVHYTLMALDWTREPSRVVLSVHGGCDARGGFTFPVVFRLRNGFHEFYESMCLNETRICGMLRSDLIWTEDTAPSDYGYVCTHAIDRELDRPNAPYDLPAFDLESILGSSDHKDAKLIHDKDNIIAALGGTVLTPEQRVKAAADIEANTRALIEDFYYDTLQDLSEKYYNFVAVLDGRAYLFGQYEELQLGSRYDFKLEDHPELEVSNPYIY